MRQKQMALVTAFVLVIACGLGVVYWVRSGFSARGRPSSVEAFVARRVRSLGVPSRAKNDRNPVPLTSDVLADARAHFADHCATCHANDGSGHTQIGQNLYPKAPDMRLPDTQSLSDGELYYIIHNGIRFTGMPAWGSADEHADEDSWKLVHFIRHLPTLTPAEIAEMEALNPKSPSELEEEKEDQKFLSGSAVEPSTMNHESMKMPAAERPKHD